MNRDENDNAADVGVMVYEALSEAGGMDCNTSAAAEEKCEGRRVDFGCCGHERARYKKKKKALEKPRTIGEPEVLAALRRSGGGQHLGW